MPLQDGTLQNTFAQNFQAPVNIAGASRPENADEKYFDDINVKWRFFEDKDEAHNWTAAKLGQRRYINVGGTLDNNGNFAGGVETLFIYLAGTSINDLVQFTLANGLSLGETSTTAYRGDRGKTAFDHTSLTNNPHNVTKAQVGLPLADNTSDINKPVSNPTAAAIAQAIADLVDSSPTTLNTLNELAAALGDDPNFATTIMTLLGQKAPIASPTFTGIASGETAALGTNTTQLATTAFVQNEKRKNIRLVDSATNTTTTFGVTDDIVLMDATTANQTIQLEDATTFENSNRTKTGFIKKVNVGNSVTVTTTGGQLIDGATTLVLDPDSKHAIEFASLDGNYYIIGRVTI